MKLRVLYACLLFSLLSLFRLSGSDREDPERNLVVAAVGDSITWGFAVENRLVNSWPARLERMSGGVLNVKNFGRSGATLNNSGDKPYRDSPVYGNALKSSPHIVIIALGTNDGKIRNHPFVGSFLRDYSQLIRSFRALESQPRIFICYPPPVFPNRWDIESAFLEETVIPLIDQVAEENGVDVIDLFTPLKYRTDLIPDGVHPDDEGARIIAETIYGELIIPFISFL